MFGTQLWVLETVVAVEALIVTHSFLSWMVTQGLQACFCQALIGIQKVILREVPYSLPLHFRFEYCCCSSHVFLQMTFPRRPTAGEALSQRPNK
jgi:hypothetical protein